jgi:hypothetical protein
MFQGLKRYFLRDPDPVWRWFAGQTVRRWWKHPMAIPALVPVALALGIATLYASDSSSQADQIAFWTLYTIVSAAHLVLFLHVATTPFVMIGRLGGANSLRELSLTLIPRVEIARMLFWGSFRRGAAPSLLILYMAEIVFLYFGIIAGELDFEPGEASFLVFIFLIKPPLDYLMNLAISWWQYFSAGSVVYGRLRAMLILMGLFPAIGYFLVFLSNSPFALLIIYVAKAVFAIFCCQEMYMKWHDRLREKHEAQ